MKINILKLIVAIGVSELAGIIGSFFTVAAIPTWYAGLKKAPLNPPPWIFGPVWTILYLLMGIAAYLVWSQGLGVQGVAPALIIFGIQLILNTLWSIIFFGLHNPGAALFEIALLWFAILFTTIFFYKVSPLASYLLLPYLAWVSFASYLNYAVWNLNK